ncbi:MFS transporter [Kitasatospora paracochleata]|uniref:MFS family permease n=1 Tax=Kitasatospora paracochleata TaxID=58354 RepID=A0ABT1ITQ4_9ACTN|nr:MFS transporter [Kitasatospora paracochleata]MCP2308515.1 MFS family permease [Kitasatospora paracochleata]
MTSTAALPRARRLLPADPLLRRLVLMSLVNTVGNGLFGTVSVLYLTRSVGLSAHQVALGLTAAGVCGTFAGVPMGRLADRVGSKRLLLVVGPLEAVAVLGYALVGSWAAFVALACAATVLERGAVAVRSALIARVVPGERQVASRALLRSVMNAGLVVGAGGAALVLQVDRYPAYVAVLVLDALSFLGAAALLAGLPAPDMASADGREAARPRGRRSALRDRRYLAVTALHAVLELQFAMLAVGIPLWIAFHTAAPRALVAAVDVVNCLTVVLFQVRAGRGVSGVPGAARACARGGVLLAGACLVYASAGGRGAVVASVVMLAGAVVHSVAELLTSAGGWTLSLDLADPAAHGEYQGVFMSGQAASHVIGPLVVTVTVLDHGTAGWAVLAGLLAVAGLVLPRVAGGAR